MRPDRARSALRPDLTRSAMRVKRALDLLGATLGLLALAPLIVVIAASIRLDGRGGVFYRRAARGPARQAL